MFITIYTDGACSGNPGNGGWSFVVINPKEKDSYYIKYGNPGEITTNNKMEITAVLEGVKYVKNTYGKEVDLIINTDSTYIANTYNSNWIISWKRNGWVNSKKEIVKNKELWQELDSILSDFNTFSFVKVKGHDSNNYNNLADRYAVIAKEYEEKGVWEENI